MGDFIRGCDAIKKATKTSIIVVHHCVKNGDIRGSSALFGTCDLVHKITHNEDDMSFVLESAKVKDGEPVERQMFDIKSHLLFVDNDGDDVTILTTFSGGQRTARREHSTRCKESFSKPHGGVAGNTIKAAGRRKHP